MGFNLKIFEDTSIDGVQAGLDGEYLDWLVEEKWPEIQWLFGKAGFTGRDVAYG